MIWYRSHTLIGTVIIALIFGTTLTPKGWAMLAPAPTAAQTSPSHREADLQIIQKQLESKVLRQRLKEFGLNDKEINTRLSKLSDAELHQMASRVQTMNPAGDGGIIIAVLLIGILVLLFVYLLKRV